MSNWSEIDPHLCLERIRVENYRNLGSIDTIIPDNARFICLVGTNGSSKSALMSLIIDALFSLGIERMQENIEDDKFYVPGITPQSYRKKISMAEAGPLGNAFCCRLDWKIRDDRRFSYFNYVRTESSNDQYSAELAKRFEVPSGGLSSFGGSSRLQVGGWHTKGWDIRTPGKSDDPIKKSVLLVRPVERYEVPFYQHITDRHTTPGFLTPTADNRQWPVNVVSGAEQVEQFVLDLFFEQIYTKNKQYDRFLGAIIEALIILRGQAPEDAIHFTKWPFRRMTIGRLRELSLLSAGELDVLVTMGHIVAQQLYLINKYNVLGDEKAEPSGWVFIDEFDARLHPQWQEKLLPILAKTFPNIRFMITTHSPFVLRSLPKEQSLILRLPDGQVFNDDFSSWNIEDILRVVFEVDAQWSAEVMKDLRNLESAVRDIARQEEALRLYLALAGRNEYLRSRCDRVLALMASPELRQKIEAHAAQSAPNS